MNRVSKSFYWLAALIGVVAWTAAIMGLSQLPLLTELALGSMGIVGAIWGHSVVFPRERPDGSVAGPGGASRAEVLAAMGITKADEASEPPARQRPSLPLHVNQAARQQALRLSEALNAVGVFGPVSVRMEPGGTALIAPVQEGEPVRVSAALVQHFAARALAAPEPISDQLAQNPSWPGNQLAAILAAHIDMLERQLAERDAQAPAREAPAWEAHAREERRGWTAAPGPQGLPRTA